MTTISTILADDGEQEGATDLPKNERYRLLADDRRRLVLEVLAARGESLTGESLTIDDLATEVCQRETGRDRPADDAHEAVLIALHHVHLPMLADAGVLEYDRREGRIDPAVR